MNKSEIRRLTLQGMLLEGVFWFGFCTYLAFMVTTLMDHGWSGTAAAAAMTAMSVVIMLVNPMYGYISDHFISEKKLSILLLALAAVCLLLLPFSLRSGSKLLVLLTMIGITVTGMQLISLIDAWIVGLKQEFPSINYGLIRGSGSLTYALSAQVMGTVTIAYGHGMRLWLGCGFLLLTILIALTFRSTRRIGATDAGERAGRRLGGVESFKLIFSSRQYCLLMGVSFFLLLSNAAMTTLMQLCIRDLGGTTEQIGTASAFCAASEVPCMFLMAYLMKKIGEKTLLVFSGMVYVVRMFVTASVTTVDGLIYAQLLQGITYAVLLPVSMSYLCRIVDERVRSTAVTTYFAVAASLTGILGNLITSTLLATGLSAQSAMIFFAFSALIGFALALYGLVHKIW